VPVRDLGARHQHGGAFGQADEHGQGDRQRSPDSGLEQFFREEDQRGDHDARDVDRLGIQPRSHRQSFFT
jgi:hypothetical protein